MENLLTSVNIRNPGLKLYYQELKDIMLEVEVYQFLGLFNPWKISINFV